VLSSSCKAGFAAGSPAHCILPIFKTNELLYHLKSSDLYDENSQLRRFDIPPSGGAIKFNFESVEGFTFFTAEKEDSRQECELWNTLCTEKLKEAVASAKTTFRWPR